jgi:hypothetical protein
MPGKQIGVFPCINYQHSTLAEVLVHASVTTTILQLLNDLLVVGAMDLGSGRSFPH